MIARLFPEYERRIAVGISGEGSDCFGYDDLISRDHDFGTGVCLWLTESDHAEIGEALASAYDELVSGHPGGLELSARLRERRGVMTIRTFYSNILGTPVDTDKHALSDEEWLALDHTCLATAVNGEVFRDDLGEFSRFRELLLGYYPDRVWRIRLVQELHLFASSVQVNYARCITRGDTVAAEICRANGVRAAMELVFLLRRAYPPYYKWTYRAMTELERSEALASLIRDLAEAKIDPALWEGREYNADRLNRKDPVVLATERVAARVVNELRISRLTERTEPYLEIYCDEIAAGI